MTKRKNMLQNVSYIQSYCTMFTCVGEGKAILSANILKTG